MDIKDLFEVSLDVLGWEGLKITLTAKPGYQLQQYADALGVFEGLGADDHLVVVFGDTRTVLKTKEEVFSFCNGMLLAARLTGMEEAVVE